MQQYSEEESENDASIYWTIIKSNVLSEEWIDVYYSSQLTPLTVLYTNSDWILVV